MGDDGHGWVGTGAGQEPPGWGPDGERLERELVVEAEGAREDASWEDREGREEVTREGRGRDTNGRVGKGSEEAERRAAAGPRVRSMEMEQGHGVEDDEGARQRAGVGVTVDDAEGATEGARGDEDRRMERKRKGRQEVRDNGDEWQGCAVGEYRMDRVKLVAA